MSNHIWKRQLQSSNAALSDTTRPYTAIPEGHTHYSKRATMVLRIHKNSYRSREEPMLWFLIISKNLRATYNFRQSLHDRSLFFDDKMIVLTYVDDFLVLGEKKQLHGFVKKKKKNYEITSTAIDGDYDFLGLLLGGQHTNAFTLHRQPFIKWWCTKSPWLTKIMHIPNPFPTDISRPTFSRKSLPMDVIRKNYSAVLGSMLYLRFTKPELLHAMQLLSQFASSPTDTAV